MSWREGAGRAAALRFEVNLSDTSYPCINFAFVRCGKVRFQVKRIRSLFLFAPLHGKFVRYFPPTRSVGAERCRLGLALCELAAPQRTEMLVLLRASADRASPTTRLRPRPVPVMATEEPVLRPQLMGAAALTGTATGVAVSGFKVATLGAAAALYSGPLALPELPGSELGPYVLVRL